MDLFPDTWLFLKAAQGFDFSAEVVLVFTKGLWISSSPGNGGDVASLRGSMTQGSATPEPQCTSNVWHVKSSLSSRWYETRIEMLYDAVDSDLGVVPGS